MQGHLLRIIIEIVMILSWHKFISLVDQVTKSKSSMVTIGKRPYFSMQLLFVQLPPYGIF